MRRRVWVPLAVLLAVTVCDDPAGPGPGRTVMDWGLDSPPHFNLHDISGASADALVAVGDGGVVLRYDGSQWTEAAMIGSEDGGTVWSTGPDEFFIGDRTRPAIYHCRSSGCTTHADFPGNINAFTDLWAYSADDVFAVGGYRDNILHYDGESWSAMPGEIPERIRSIWGFGPDQVYAVGYYGVSYWDGVEWAPVETGLDASAYTNLGQVWGSDPDNVFALDVDNWGSGSDIIYFDGTSWQAMEITSSASLRGLWGSSPNNVFVIGQEGFNVNVYGVIFHFDGSTWTQMDIPIVTPLQAVWGTSATDVWAAGEQGIILHYDGLEWSIARELDGTGRTLEAVTGTDDGALWAVGDYTILRSSGGTWAPQQVGGDGGDEQPDVAAAGSGVFVASNRGYYARVIHLNRGTYDLIGAPMGGIEAVWRASETEIIALGNRWIDHYTSGWTEQEEFFDLDARLWDVWGAAPDDVWAVGTIALHFDGAEWREVTVSRMGFELAAVWGSSGDDVFAVGEYGVIVHWDGREWRRMESGTYTDLFGVWGDSPRNVYAVGAAGTIIHYDGEVWSPMELPFTLTADLNDVWLDETSDVIIVGEVGTILRGDR